MGVVRAASRGELKSSGEPRRRPQAVLDLGVTRVRCTMQVLPLLVAMLHFSPGHMWQPKSQQNLQYPDISGGPDSNTALLRRRPALSAYTIEDRELTLSPSWPDPSLKFGQFSAVTVDKHGHVVVFHRGPHVWDGNSFDTNDNYMKKEEGPIQEDTIVVLDPVTGKKIKSWGKNLFYLPHGLTIDDEDNLWVTDVALHQIFKFPPLAMLNDTVTKPLLVRGERFVNGKDEDHFCKPSAVAVLKNGDFFVSDGYCNTRIIKYDKRGARLMIWGRSSFYDSISQRPGPYQFNVPHALTIAEDRSLLCAADRENGRVQCFSSDNGTFAYEIYDPEVIGSRLFSVAYTPTKGGLFYIVNGPPFGAGNVPVQGIIVDASSLNIVSTFQPGSSALSNPHDVAVSPDGESVYVVELDPYRVWKFVHKGGENESKSSPVGAGPLSSLVTSPPITQTSSSKPTEKVEDSNTTSTLPIGLNLMANSSLVKGLSSSMVAITSLMVVLFCVFGGGIVWYLRSRRRGRPPVLEFDMSEPGYERNSLVMHDDEDDD